MRTGPAACPTNERYVDQSRRNSHRDTVDGNESLQNDGRQAPFRTLTTGNSPMHVMSPMSNRSGSSTPVQTAPVVPSMLPLAQNEVSRDAPMDVLDALRSRKASLARSAAHANGEVTVQEVNLLKAKLKAADLREAQYRSEVKTLASQLKQLEDLPAQLAALKDLVEKQQQTAANGPSPGDVEIRLSALENAKPAIETSQFNDLQSHVQDMKVEFDKLQPVTGRLDQLRSSVTQQDQKFTDASSRIDELKTKIASLVTAQEELKKVQEQQKQPQALRSDSMKKAARTELKPDIERLQSILDQQQGTIDQLSTRVDGSEKTVEDVSTKFEANQRRVDGVTATVQASETTLNELRALNLLARVTNLQEKVIQIDKNEGRTFEKAQKIREDFDRMYDQFNDLDDDFKDLDREIKDHIGPIRDAFKEKKDQTIIKRLKRLEGEHDRIATYIDKQPANPTDFNQLRDLIVSVGEDTEKLAKDLQNIRVANAAPQQKNKPTESPLSAAKGSDPLLTNKELTEKCAHLKENAIKLDEAWKAIKYVQDKQQKTISEMEKSQKALQVPQDATTDQIKTFEDKQTTLTNEYNTIVERLDAFENGQAKLLEGHITINTAFQTLETKLLQEQDKTIGLVNKYHEEPAILGSQQKVFQTQQDSLSEEQSRLTKASEGFESRIAASDKIVEQLSKIQHGSKETSQSLESRVTALDKFVSETRKQVKEVAQGLVDSVDGIDKTVDKLKETSKSLKSRVTALETTPVSAIYQDEDTFASSSRISGFEHRLRSVENHIEATCSLGTRCDKLEADIEEVRNDIDESMDKLKEGFLGVFEAVFDPFKASVEKDLENHVSSLAQINETLAILQGKDEAFQEECPAAGFSAPQLEMIQNMVQGATDVKQDLSRLQDSLHRESEQRNAAVEDLKQQVAIKQDAMTTNNLIDAIRHSVRTLTSQYENLVTDDLYQRMTHWFMHSYGHPSASMLQHVPEIQNELLRMRNLMDVFTTIPNSAQTLSALAGLEPQLMNLAQIGPQLANLAQSTSQLTALAQSSPSTGKSHSSLTETNEALEAMQISVAEARQKYEKLEKVVGNLQTSLHNLNSEKTPFAKVQSLAVLEKTIASLRAELKATTEVGMQARKEFETKAGKEHDLRWNAEKAIKSSIESVKISVGDLSERVDKEVDEREKAERELLSTNSKKLKELENAQKTSSDQSEKVQKAIVELRSDLVEALGDFKDGPEPKPKEFLDWLPILFLHVGQLQWVIEDLNQNLPKGGLKIDWHRDWKAEMEPPPPFPGTDAAPATPKGKGKGKKQA